MSAFRIEGDSRIIELYWLRDESAIQVTSRKYGPYLFKIAYNVLTDTRELSIDRLRCRTRKKRLDSGYMLALSELKECVSGTDTTEQQTSMLLLAESISSYLRSLSPEARSLFVGRYFYLDSVQEAAAYCGMSAAKAKSLLHRTRKGLKAYLEKEGFHL